MPSHRIYGQGPVYSSSHDIRVQNNANVFSDSSLSQDLSSHSSESDFVSHQRSCAKKKVLVHKTANQCDRPALTDVSNITSKKVTRGRGKKANAKSHIPENIPNFDSFDDYSLVVQTVTPIKTHVSQSTNSHSYNWDKYPTSEMGSVLENDSPFSPVTSSPRIASKTHSSSHNQHSASDGSVSSGYSGVVTRSMSDKLSYPSPAQIRSKRQRRLQHVLNDSYGIETSTPDRMPRKRTRLDEVQASPVAHVEDDLVLSMEQMSLNNSLHESLHQSLTTSPDHEFNSQSTLPPIHSSQNFQLPVVMCLRIDAVNGPNSSASSSQRSSASRCLIQSPSMSVMQSPSLFCSDDNITANTTDSTRPGGFSRLEDLQEEEEEEKELFESQHLENSHSECDGVIQEASRSIYHARSPSLSEMAEYRRSKLLHRECGQLDCIDWYEFMDSKTLRSMTKIGEGVYGEVFLHQDKDCSNIIKVMPFGGQCTVNDEPQRKTVEVHSEVKISRLLSDLGCNFIAVNRFLVVRGEYPQELLTLWDQYDQSNESENDRPDYFSTDQRYIVFDFAHGGIALEAYKFRNAAEGLSILLQVGWSLATAESQCQFEHRDLHWCNILVAETNDEVAVYKFPCMADSYEVRCEGVRANIIDFTLSRLAAPGRMLFMKPNPLSFSGLGTSCDCTACTASGDRGDDVLYSDLSEDETLFQGYGDYQFDIYRQMKDVTRNKWRGFCAVTNVLWMRYLVDKLIKAKTFPTKRGVSPSAVQFKKMLLDFYVRCESYYSTVQMVFTDQLFQKFVQNQNTES